MIAYSDVESNYMDTIQGNTEVKSLALEGDFIQQNKFIYGKRSQLLKNINLEIKKGELITLTGESGCGKSTILQIMMRFYTPESGEILWNGQNSREIPLKDWRKSIGYVPQNIKIFQATLLENICLKNTQEEAQKVIYFCQQHGFDKYFHSLPQSYLTIIGENGVHLSGGQTQLLALSRVLYHKPQLLLLDEATSAMDTHTENFVIQLLQSLQKETAIVWVSHKPEIANLGKRIYHINAGKSLLKNISVLP
ncbi:MAG: ABC transporter ATP-binding protein [Microscillaceae bacterium]|nr:ABC transporter ATP-binding protein [Microscillaceae bacterium]